MCVDDSRLNGEEVMCLRGVVQRLQLYLKTFLMESCRTRLAVRLLCVLTCITSLGCVLMMSLPSYRQVGCLFGRCHNGTTGNGVPFTDYFSHIIAVYTQRHHNHSHHNRKCPPLPLRFPLNASLFHCDWYNRPPLNCTNRLRAKLHCDETRADIVYEWVELGTPPSLYQFQDPCVARVVAERCTENGSIPRVMHYVQFGRLKFAFHALLSVLSAVKFLQPCLVLLHADYLPNGTDWEALLQLVPHVIHLNRSAPTAIFDHVIKVVEHKTDVARLEAIRKFGGVYADTDHIILNPIQGLLHHDVVMGTEGGVGFGNGFFLGKPNATFLDLWYDSYKTFDDSQWAVHSVLKPRQIYNEHVTRNTTLGVHVVDSFFRPQWSSATKLFYENRYNWTTLYGVHLYHRFNAKFFTGRLETQNSSLGEVTRYVLYGGSDRCFGGKALDVTPVRMEAEEKS